MRPAVVVPCYNEEARLDLPAFSPLLEHCDVWFVNDGSSDGTGDLLDRAARADPGRIRVVHQNPNGGKGEAVRAGALAALDAGAPFVGYLDADLATPPLEFLRMLDVARDSGAAVVLGSRVRLLGRRVERDRTRHLLGRVFAATASLLLDLPVYDTQCGAKLFRADPLVSVAFSEPFVSRWAFDVELIGRLLEPPDGAAGLGADDFVEVPLASWVDVAGSKLTRRAMLSALWDLSLIASDLRARRARVRGARGRAR